MLCLFVESVPPVLAQIPDSYRTADSLLTSPDDSVKALALGELAANTAAFERSFARADSLMAEAKTISRQVKSNYIMAMSSMNEGIIESSREDFPKAAEFFQRAYGGFKATEDLEMQVKALTRLDMAYFGAKEFKLAEKYALQALQILENNPSLSRDMLGHCYNELSNIYGMQDDQQKSLEYVDKALAVYRKTGDEMSEYGSIFNSAVTLRKLGRLDESLARFRQVERFAKRTRDDYYLVFAYAELPVTLMEMRKYDDALRINKQGLQLLESNSSLRSFDLLRNTHTNFHKIYAAKNDYKNAYEHYQLATQFGDSLTDLEKKKELARLETQFETKHKEERIQELDALSEARQRQVLVLGAFSLAILGFLGAFYWQYRRLQRSKAKISEQSDQMKLLMKELHHRVKNNLAIVSSLLKLQSNRIEEESAAKAVREGQQRVEAMSLIHQRLYQTDLLTSINMREYITDLCENLMTAYGYGRDNFDLDLNIEQEELDVDLAIPLGLILNELLTNAFKYAYHDVEKPSLVISLTGERDLTLDIQDNGPGIDEAAWQSKRGSFGKRLINNLSDQIGGDYQIENDGGTHYKLHISEKALRKVA